MSDEIVRHVTGSRARLDGTLELRWTSYNPNDRTDKPTTKAVNLTLSRGMAKGLADQCEKLGLILEGQDE